jgi:glyoxylase-like metal-dependent hydrolase (beta-lactamase superfamily II)
MALAAAAFIGWLAFPAASPQTSASPYPAVTGKAYKFEKIADGVYYATSTGSMVTGSNVPVIVNDRDVLIVDTGTTPAAARALLQDLKAITDRPVRTVVNTHFHYDHTDGNSVFAGSAEIIGHEYVRYAILNLDVLRREPFRTSQLTNVPERIDSLKKQIAAEREAGRRAVLERQLAVAQAGWKELEEIKPTAPDVTYSSRMVLHRGGREIQLLFLGRGHTPGDTVVFLPKERIVCTGDLMESQLAYMGDALFDEWMATLEALKMLDFDLVLPGHGVPFREKSKITAYQGYLRDLVAQVADLRKGGASAEEAARKVDLTSHRAEFPQIQGPGADLRGVRRLYEWMDERRGK